jgi:hypothetical protein
MSSVCLNSSRISLLISFMEFYGVAFILKERFQHETKRGLCFFIVKVSRSGFERGNDVFLD